MRRTENPFRVLSAHDPQGFAEWVELWESWPAREVFAHPNYVKLFARPPDQPLCACWRSAGERVLYPFVLRDLTAEPYWRSGLGPAADIATPYGYGGPFSWGPDDSSNLPASFWRHFDAWAAENCLVSEFVRFSLFADGLLPYPGRLEENRKNVVRDLTPDEDALWMDFKQKVRKNVKKARRSGVRVEIDSTGRRLSDFLRVYGHTMQRRHAPEEYMFTGDFFRRLQDGLPGQFAYFHALHSDRVVSTELVLVSAEAVYSFLGGTHSDAFDLRPNDLLKYEIILWAKRQGKRRFVLGGGYQPDDGIYHYKVAFAPGGSVPFKVGYRTFGKELYEKIVNARKGLGQTDGKPWQPRKDYFPAYRS